MKYRLRKNEGLLLLIFSFVFAAFGFIGFSDIIKFGIGSGNLPMTLLISFIGVGFFIASWEKK